MPHRVLVVTTANTLSAGAEEAVRAHAGGDAEVHVVAPASKISRLDRLTNAEDDARSDADHRAVAAADAIPHSAEAHVGDVDPLLAIEDALRTFEADEIVVLTALEDDATWLEQGIGEEARERVTVPVTHVVAR